MFLIFDDRLHDLRKYGFTFITAFLTGSTILFTTYLLEPNTSFPEGLTEGIPFPASIKAIILGVTLLLILGLYILDRNYRVFQKAASTRANVLERLLNIELSDVITQRYRLNTVDKFVTALYFIFVFGVGLLATAVLSETPELLLLVYLAAFATSGAIVVLSFDSVLMKFGYGMVDWFLDKTECTQGDEVRVIMTNIGNEPFPSPQHPLKKGEVMWKLVKQCENANICAADKVVASGEMEADFGIMKADSSEKKETDVGIKEAALSGENTICNMLLPYQNYIWTIPTEKDGKGQYIEAGIYCLYRRVFDRNGAILPENEMVPLSRKLRIMKKPPDPPAKPSLHHVTIKKEKNDGKKIEI